MTLKILDSHFHVWDLEKQNLPWLAGTDGTITNTYKFSDLEQEYAKHADVEFVGGVYVEVDGEDPIQEDKIVFQLMQDNPKFLAAMLRSNVSPEMRLPVIASGVREPLHIDSEPKGRCLQQEFIDGLRVLAKAGLPFESCNRFEELNDAYVAFSQVPECTVILNHLGNVSELTEEYKEVMQKFAKLPNLYLKVSGFATQDKQFVADTLKFIRETFSSDKLLYASNWPVVELYSTFDEHLNILREEFNDDQDFFMNNAIAAYGIKL